MLGKSDPLFADLHIHSSFSDGTDAPKAIVERAAAIGLSAIALTDHDTLAGLRECGTAARHAGLEFLPGTEISASYGAIEVHIIGLGIRGDDADLAAAIEQLHQGRAGRVEAMVAKLNAAGIQVPLEEVVQLAGPHGTLGRMHVARALKTRGVTRTVQEAFDRFLKARKRAYVPKKNLSCAHAIELIHGASGLAIIGHPGVGMNVMKILPRLLQLDFDGIEVFHSKHNAGQMDYLMQVARERNILVSGGSDCHGTASKEPEMGKVRLPYQYFEAIKTALASPSTTPSSKSK